MALNFDPRVGQILLCDYDRGAVPPEMTKRRPALVISRKLEDRDCLCTVVPLSSSAPTTQRPWHVQIETKELPEVLREKASWAKCDMVATVSYERLDAYGIGKDPRTGRRRYHYGTINRGCLRAVRRGVLHALSLGFLDEHLR